MHAPGADALLLAWEQGRALSPTRRALVLLGAAMPGTAPGDLAAMPLGARDAALLRLRQALFGDTVAALAACPVCQAQLDVGFDARDLAGEAPPHDGHRLCAHDAQVDYRLPTSDDVLAAAGSDDAPRALLERCVLQARAHGGELAPPDWPAGLAAAVSGAIAEADPLAHIELALQCPSCRHTWNALFDIGAFLWIEVQAMAQRLLRDVHVLARAYGWREADILAMSAWRRQHYLELAQS
jgi:hypothetical protein